jgi:hypothetical protein
MSFHFKNMQNTQTPFVHKSQIYLMLIQVEHVVATLLWVKDMLSFDINFLAKLHSQLCEHLLPTLRK